jgi:uncharacterized protein YdbL (DUF1318 family)
MKRRFVGFVLFAVSLTIVLACITVNLYFPEAQVKKTADEIVDEIRKKDAKDAKDKSAPEVIKEEARISQPAGFTLVPAAFAQEETNVSNPSIRALKESMKQRFPSLKPYYDAGHIGENNNGLVEVRDEGGLSLKDKGALRGLVKDENDDRMQLYGEVAKALKIDPGQVGRVQKLFAGSWINAASSGWWVQKENGEWVRK